ncbi:MAG: DUF58 domain-containing protein [Myxococcota bacterium]
MTKPSWMNRLRRGLGTARDLFPLTFLGVAVTAGSVVSLVYYGVERIDLLLLVVGIVGLGMVALSLLFSVSTAIYLYWRFRKQTNEKSLVLECGYPRRTGFAVASPWFIPFVRVGWAWESPTVHLVQRRHGLRVHEEVTPVYRAMREEIVRRFEVGDAFGVCRIRFRGREERKLRFTPAIGNLKQMHVIRSMSAGDQIAHPDGPPEGERADMRHYVPGDPVRFILWKVFARSREVVVRTPERAIGPVRQTVAYVVSGPGDEPAAGAARVAVDSGALGGDWVLGADGTEAVADTGAAALEVLARSGEVDAEEGAAGLRDFLKNATPGSMGRALVFVPGRPGPWLDRLANAMAQGNVPQIEFMVCTDGVAPPADGSFLQRALRRDKAYDPRTGIGSCSAEEVSEVCQRLAKSRARVTVLDRLTGRVYTEAHQRALAAQAQRAAAS